MNPILVVILLIVLAIIFLPHWPYAANWSTGYYPSVGLGTVLIILVILMLLGRI